MMGKEFPKEKREHAPKPPFYIFQSFYSGILRDFSAKGGKVFACAPKP